jgi:hypothetical protein
VVTTIVQRGWRSGRPVERMMTTMAVTTSGIVRRIEGNCGEDDGMTW